MPSSSAPCPHCGAVASGNFCASCGKALTTPTCLTCGTVLAAGASFCHKCGSPLGRPAPSVDQTGRIMSREGAQPPNRDTLAWLIAGVLVVAIVAGVLYS